MLAEDVAVNNIGAGNMDGTGIGPRGEPGVYLKKRKLVDPIMDKVLRRNIQGFKEFAKHARRNR